MATLSNSNNDTVITGTDLADKIYSSGVNVQIYGNEGDDTIENRGYDVTIEAGAGNDSIWTDVLTSYGSDNYRSATVDGGDGDDTIKVRDHQTSLNGGAGSDVISVYSSSWLNNTLQGGKGTDVIYGGKTNVFVYEEGDGDDTIYYAKSNDTVQIATNSGYTSLKNGNDLLINVGNGFMTFKGAANLKLNIETHALKPRSVKTLMEQVSDKQFQHFMDILGNIADAGNYYTDEKILGLLSSSIKYFAAVRKAFSEPGTDLSGQANLIALSGASVEEFANFYATLNEYSPGTNPQLWGTSAENYVDGMMLIAHVFNVWASCVSVGADLKENNLYAAIEDYKNAFHGIGDIAEDFLGNSYPVKAVVALYKSGVNVVAQIFKSHKRYYADGSWDLGDTARFLMDISTAGIYGITHSLSKGADDAIYELLASNALSDEDFSVSERVSDKLSTFFDNVGKALGDIIINVSGLGLPAGMSYNANKTALNASSKFKGTQIDLANFAATVKKVNASALVNAVNITGNALGNSIKGGSGSDTISGGEGNDTLLGNSGNDTLYGLNGDDSIDGGAGDDVIFGGVGNDNIKGGKGNDLFVYTDGNDTITDYTANADRISLAGGNSAKWLSHITGVRVNGSDVTLVFSNNNSKTLTLKKGVGKKVAINYDTAVFGRDGTKSIVIHSTFSGKFNGIAYKDIDASACTSAVSILGGALNGSIKGGAGYDTLNGGAGSDTLTGGAGNDLFVFSAGNDTITDYVSGADRISLGSAVKSTAVNGSDVVLTTAKGSLTVKKAKGKSLDLISSAGKSFSTIIGGSTLTVTNTTASPVTIDSAVKVVDASARTKAVKITGNSSANTILGGRGADSINGAAGNDKLYGGAGSDTLTGGKGNDSLWGDAGKDTFAYFSGDGKDIIFGFENNDLLQITGTFSASYNSKTNAVAFKVGSTANAITLKEFTATTFHVNNDTYVIKGEKFVKK